MSCIASKGPSLQSKKSKTKIKKGEEKALQNSRKRAAQSEATASVVPTNTVATGASAAASAESSSTDAIDVVVVNEKDEIIDIFATNDSEDEFA